MDYRGGGGGGGGVAKGRVCWPPLSNLLGALFLSPLPTPMYGEADTEEAEVSPDPVTQ